MKSVFHHLNLYSESFYKDLLDTLSSLSHLDDNMCLIWDGHKDSDGYGMLIIGKTKYYAHRLSGLAFKLITHYNDRFNINHTCHKRSCWNPSHLYAGSQAQNGKDLRSRNTHCKNGHPYSEYGYYSKERSRYGTLVRRCRLCRRS